MLVRPPYLALGEIRTVSRAGRWVCDLGDEERRRCFRNSIYEDPEERNLEKDQKAYPEAEQKALAVMEPQPLLLLRETNPGKVRLELQLQST